MKSNQIIDIINKTAKDLNPDTEDYNFQNAVREITSKIKDSMKFSYLLYYFVLMFGYIALISSPTTDQVKLLKYLKLKDFNEIIEKFNHLKSKPLGKDIIQANNVHGKYILSVILNCAKRLNINNEKLKNAMTKVLRLAFNALGTDTESVASSSTNNSRNDLWRRNGNQRQNELEHYKSQFEALQSELNNLKADNRVSSPIRRTNRGRIAKPERKANKYLNRVKHDEDELLLHYPLEEYNSEYDSRNMIGRHEAQHAVSNIYGVQLEDYSFGGEFNPDQKSDMHNKIVTIMNGLNQETIEETNNTANHMIQNEMEILNIQAVNDFWQDVEKLNRRNKINNSKEKYLDHLEESTYERVRFHEEKPPSKKKSKSGKRGNTLPDGMKITKLPPINYAEGDETDDGIPSNEANDYSDDNKEALPPENSLYFVLSNSKVWTLPSGKNVGDIYTEKISENAHTVKNKKRLTAIKKAILRG
ncbi:unnamed protein product [Rhizophagus irregularis]|nr:unnamed protein product [Rhizophagus irregularis]